LELAHENRIDLALTLEPPLAPGLEVRALFEDELLYAFSRDHPWADGRPLSAQEIAQQPMIAYRRGSATAQLLQEYFDKQQIEPSLLMEIGNVAAIRELVNHKVGVAVLAPWVFEQELAKGLVGMRALGPKSLRRRWSVVCRPGGRLALVEEEFIKVCRRQLASMRLDRKDLPAHALVTSR
jgi:DNA-binding transcriptional LysR family regulator